MKNHGFTRYLTTAALLLVLTFLSGCSGGKRINTSWASNGNTERAAVKSRLGEPAEYYENGRIMAYRLVRVGRGFHRYDEELTIKPPGEARENIIFTFDANGVLQTVTRIDLKD